MMSTRHRDRRSLQHYQNLRGREGLQQQRDPLGSPPVRRLEGCAETVRGDIERGDAVILSESTSNAASSRAAPP